MIEVRPQGQRAWRHLVWAVDSQRAPSDRITMESVEDLPETKVKLSFARGAGVVGYGRARSVRASDHGRTSISTSARPAALALGRVETTRVKVDRAYENSWSGLSGTTNRLLGTIIDGNTATDGAGLWVKTSSTTAVTLVMTEPQIKNNTATGMGGGLYAGNKVTFHCFSDDTSEGSSGPFYGFSKNTAGTGPGGAAQLESGATLKSFGTSATANGCDFVASGTLDNTPNDIAVFSSGAHL